MNPALLEMPTRMGQPFEASSLGALDATASGETRVIRRTDESLLRQMTENLDKKLLSVLACRTPEEFGKARQSVWERYFRARRALSDTINLVIPKKFIESVRCATLQRISEDLERSRAVLFGEEIAKQFEFTMWTVNRIQATAREIERAGEPSDRNADSRLHEDFCLYTAWGQFHFDCVLASMKFEQPIPSDIQFPIRDGLRAWVNAAAIVEEALSLRVPDGIGGDVQFFEQPWNDEDEELLASSMKDLDAEQPSDV